VRIVRAGPERIADLEPLWLVLRDHHHTVTPDWGPVHDDAESWRRRRADYERWLAEPDAFAFIAEEGDRPVGYALGTVNDGSPTWAELGRFGFVETLSILPEARGRGIGEQLMAAVADYLATLGITEIHLTAVATNERAMRFYERAGFIPAFVTLRRR
jgi:GNAT superfamily N-acetyltransferase